MFVVKFHSYALLPEFFLYLICSLESGSFNGYSSSISRNNTMIFPQNKSEKLGNPPYRVCLYNVIYCIIGSIIFFYGHSYLDHSLDVWIFVAWSILSLRILQVHKCEKCQGRKVLIIVDIPKRYWFKSSLNIYLNVEYFVKLKTQYSLM